VRLQRLFGGTKNGQNPAQRAHRFLKWFGADDSGQGLIEYALVVALVGILALAALQLLGKKTSNTLSNAASYLK
jgi:pilus assembly protein Flp/PilA